MACFCPDPQRLLIEVRAGTVARVWDAAGRAVPITERTNYSIDRLFDILDQHAERDDVVEVRFDLRWHFPAYIRTDVSLGHPDDWGVIDVRGLRPIP